MKKVWLSTVTAISIALLISGGAAQSYEQEVVGTVTCSPCVVKGSRRIDLDCARSCLAPKKSSDITKNTSPSADRTKNTNTGLDTTNTNSTQGTNLNLVIITDGDYKTIAVDNPDKVKSHLAHRVAVVGYWVKGSFHVISVRTI
jgi:hypothetical protein